MALGRLVWAGMKIEDSENTNGWRAPRGWLKASWEWRDASAMLAELEKDNERRKARGLPTFEPSMELAISIIRNHNP